MAKVLGIATIQVNGTTLKSMPGATIDLGGVKRSAVTGAAGDVDYTEEPQPGQIDCTLKHDSSYDATFFANIVGATVLFKTDTGQTYIGSDAFVQDPPKITAADGGKVPLTLVCRAFTVA